MKTIHPIIEQILKMRGLTDSEEIEEFLSDKPSLTYDPFLLKDLEAGVDFILSAIKEKKKICIYGDYDADGVTSISLLWEVLSHLTKDLIYYIPSRFDEGYGLNKDAIEWIHTEGVDLIITVDCGSVSFDEIEFGKSIGLEFVVTDHHNINDKPANCLLINPKQQDCTYPFKHLAGCGVAFKLAQGIQRKSGLTKSILAEVLDLVAVGTIGDIVPLIGENRTLVKYGMQMIRSGRRPGLKRLLEEVGFKAENVKSENVAYIIVPHLNAAGRMCDAKIGVELLKNEDETDILHLVSQLVKYNKERKKIQDIAFCQCKTHIESTEEGDLFYVLQEKQIHEGIAGIVAGKIKEEYGKPAVIVTESGPGFLKGTGRSIEGINLYALLKKYEHLFVKFGGHAGACGFLMAEANFQELHDCLNQEVLLLAKANPSLFDMTQHVDLEMKEKDLSIELVEALECLAPFGCQNERPIFQIRRILPKGVTFMGESKQHVRFSGQGNSGKGLSYILFQKAQCFSEMLLNGNPVDVAGYPDLNQWNGNVRIQMVLKTVSNK